GHRGSGRYGEALDHYHAALRLAREIGDPYEEAKTLEGIAETTLSSGRPAAARIAYRQALDIFERLGVPEAESARIRMETMDPAFGSRPSEPRRTPPPGVPGLRARPRPGPPPGAPREGR